jgi:hypothetical protein
MNKLSIIFWINIILFVLMLVLCVPVVLFFIGASYMYGVEALKYVLWMWGLLALINIGLLFYCPKQARKLNTTKPNLAVAVASLPSFISLALYWFLNLQSFGN